jgi:CRP-like cAMP-binding protein
MFMSLDKLNCPGMKESEAALGVKTPQFIIDFLILYIPIFAKLKGEELKIIEKCMNLIEVIPGETVFGEGDRGYYVCFVVDGSLDVLKRSENGEEIVITTLSKGRSIGEMAVIDELPRSATVKAKTKATLLTLSREKFNYLLEEHTVIGIKILKGITRLLSLNLRKTSTRLVDYILPLG